MRNFAMVSGVTPRPVRYSRARAASGALRAASKYWVAASWMSMSWRRRPASRASSGELNSRLGSGMPHFGGDDADGFGEADVLHLHDEGEDVAFFVAAEAVEVAVGGVDGEGAGFFLVEGAEAGVVLRAGFAELEVVADDADDVGLLFDGLGEVIGHARYRVYLTVVLRCAMAKLSGTEGVYLFSFFLFLTAGR